MDSAKQTLEPQQDGAKARRKWTARLHYAAFAIIVSLYLLPFMRFVMSGSDEGSMLCGAERIVRGQVFARDFFEVIGPGTFYLLAIFFKIFNVSFLVARVYLFLTLLGTAGLMFYFSRRYCARFAALPIILLAGTYIGVFSGGVSYHFDSTFYALLAILCVIWWRETSRTVLLIVAGILLGLTTFVFQPKGILTFIAVVSWLLVSQGKELRLIRKIVSLTAGYIAFIVLVLVYFSSKGGLVSLIDADYIYPSQHYNSVNSVPYAFSLFKDGLWSIWLSVFGHSGTGVGIATILIIPGLVIALLPLIAPIAGAKHRFEIKNPEVLLLWLTGYGMWLSEIHRADIFHLTIGVPILAILFVRYLAMETKLVFRGVARAIYFAGICVAIWSVLAVSLVAKAVKTRVGTVAMMQQHEEQVVEFLDAKVNPGEDIVVYPYSPIYYFLSGAANPTPYSFLMYGYNTPEQFREVIRILDERDVRYVVWDTNFLKEEAQLFPRAPQPKPSELIMEPYLTVNYRKVADYDGVWMMERTAVASTSGKAGGSANLSKATSR